MTARFALRDALTAALVTALFFASIQPATAQITITADYARQLLEQSFRVRTYVATSLDDATDVLEAGAENATYDFSEMVFVLEEEGIFEGRELPADVPGADDPDFADATHVLITEFSLDGGADSTAYSFFRFADGQASIVGLYYETDEDLDEDGETPDVVKMLYDPPQTFVPLPLTYGDSWSESITQTFVLNDEPFFNTDHTMSGEVTGFGTLVTPHGSAPTLRVRSEDESTFFGITTSIVSIEFMTADSLSASIVLDDEGGPEWVSYTVTTLQTGTSTDPSIAGLPEGYRLDQNYPNPFNPSTRIGYAIPRSEHVRLTVHDVLGRQVTSLVDSVLPAGTYEVAFTADGLPSGVYFYRLEAGTALATGRMVLLQ